MQENAPADADKTTSASEPKAPLASSMANFKAALRSIRKLRKHSQDSLADATGLSRGQIVRLERSEGSLRLTTLDLLAAALDVDVIDLLSPPGTELRGRCPQEYFIRLACNLYRARRKVGLSQERLAKKSNHFRTYVTRIETLLAIPSLAGLEDLAEHLGVSVLDLLMPVPDDEYQERRLRLPKSKPVANPDENANTDLD